MKKALLTILAVCTVAQAAPAQDADGPVCAQQSAQQGPVQVGQEVSLTFESTAFQGPTTGSDLAWTEEIEMAEASYIAIHFSRFVLPPGAELTVRSPDGSHSRTYTGFGKTSHPLKEGFWAMHVPGDTAVVELRSQVPVAARAVVIDSFAHGYPNDKSAAWDWDFTKAICGTDNSRWAKCYESSDARVYRESKAVARLLINGTGACTGWLVGSEGHLMTNEHCIGSSSDALNTDYELMAEGGSCGTNCAGWLACGGTVVADYATLIQNDAALDYSLVKLPTNPTGTYGYLQLRGTGALLDERIYIPGHPAAWGKRFSVESTNSQDPSGFCEVYSLCQTPCSGGSCDVGYYCDTQSGSSGSPVLGYDDNLVVALHHCANCPNRGVPIQDVISDLGANLPNNAIGDPYGVQLWPSSSDGAGCDPNEIWFNYSPCGDWKVYDVTPGAWLGIYAYGDSCGGCVLYHVDFQIQEWDWLFGWQNVEIHNPEPDARGMKYTTSYRPNTNQIRIFSTQGFYVKVFELGVENGGFETGSSANGWLVSGAQPYPSITSNDTYVANRGEYSLGNTGSGTYGGSDALLWGYGKNIPVYDVDSGSRLYFDTYGATYPQYTHYHVKVWWTTGGTTTYDTYVDISQGIASGWSQQVFDFPASAEGNAINKIEVTFHKDHTGYLRYKPTIYMDNISLR